MSTTFQCMECGKKINRPIEECPKCGSADIDLAVSQKGVGPGADILYRNIFGR